MHCNRRLLTKVSAALALIVIAEILIGDENGAVVGAFAFAWLAALGLTRRAIWGNGSARVAMIAGAVLALVLVDDPSFVGWMMFWLSLSLAALLPRQGFDDALAWSRRLAWHAVSGIVAPFADAARVGIVGQRRGRSAGRMRSVGAVVALPLIGGAAFIALFASANPVIGRAFSLIVLPDMRSVTWRALFALCVLITIWTSLRPRAGMTRPSRYGRGTINGVFEPGVATLILSLVTFNVIFAVENALDIVFLWSGAGLPAGVSMADYAHRGAYSLIITAVLAGVFVLLALRPGSAGAASPFVRRLVTVWIVQNLLLVASSALRTLDYVDVYGMTVWRLSALAWMELVATGLALIGWRLLTRRTAAWLINANALAGVAVLATASVVDLAATAAAWNARTAIAEGEHSPSLDLCYMGQLGTSSLVSLALLERHVQNADLRDRLAYLRWTNRNALVEMQSDWRSWTPRNARRLATVDAMLGGKAPRLRPALDGRDCGGAIMVPMPPAPNPTPPPPPPPLPTPPKPLTTGAQR